MDLFNRKRGDWVNKAKAAGAEASKKLTPAVPVANADNEDDDEVGKAQKKNKKQNKGKGAKDAKADPNAGKSAIQLAREKFAAAKIAKSAMKNNKGTGANARTVGV